MKAIFRYLPVIKSTWVNTSISLVIYFLFLILSSCQKYTEDMNSQESVKKLKLIQSTRELTDSSVQSMTNVYFGHKRFYRGSGAPFQEMVRILSPDFDCYDGNFILKIKNGGDKRTRVASAEIRIDGILVAGPSDFSKNVSLINKSLSGLTAESILEVKLNSTPGSFIDLWIEGTMIIITPNFTQIGPLTQNSIPPGLPEISDNAITGTWSPETINTSKADTITFTFTPAAGQCAIATIMIIEIKGSYNGPVTDFDGNVYPTVRIGDQWWLTENLKTTKFNNGDLIGTTTPAKLNISNEAIPAYQWAYNGSEEYVDSYGRLYTWYTVTDSRGICPLGWHVPTDSDWTTLADYLINNGYGFEGSGDDIAQAMASQSGPWRYGPAPGNPGYSRSSNNSSGFSAIPTGIRLSNGTFHGLGTYTSWCTSTEINDDAWVRVLEHNNSNLVRISSDKNIGGSIRCVRDN